jgi:MFS family permease
LLASLLTFLAFSAACGASTTLIQLYTLPIFPQPSIFLLIVVLSIMIRWLQGIGAAGVFSLTLVFYELIPPTKYALSASVTNIIVSLSFLTGPLIGGAITKNGQWKWVFWVK